MKISHEIKAIKKKKKNPKAEKNSGHIRLQVCLTKCSLKFLAVYLFFHGFKHEVKSFLMKNFKLKKFISSLNELCH